MVKNVLKKNEKRRKNNKGFSLVELIVVIAIMAVLVGVLAPQFIKYVERSRQSTDLQNVEELKNAIEVAAADDGLGSATSVTITIDNKKATIGGVASIDSLAKTNVDLKSSGWGKMVFTYSTTDLKWTDDGSVTYNSKSPARNMAEVFSLTGKNK